MKAPLILASGSEIRAQMLHNAGVVFDVAVARIDEEAVRQSLEVSASTPRDVADALAEMKAHKISEQFPDALVLGCDQVLDHGGTILCKPQTPDDARAQLGALCGGRHMLLSAAVIVKAGLPIWRHIGQASMVMRDATPSYIDGYLDRNWDSIRHSVGGYKLEEEGVRLFTRVDGDYFTVLGMPLLELLAFLTLRGELEQ